MQNVGTTISRSITSAFEGILVWFGSRLPLAVAGIVVVLLSWWLSRVLFGVTRRVLAKTSTTGRVDLLVARFVRSVTLGVGVFVALGVLGVNVSALVASLGLVGLTLGLALKDVLANYVSGVMLLLQGPFQVGDSVLIGDTEGVVDDITARATSLRAPDGRQVHVPNSTVFASTITNVTCNPVRRFEVSFVVPCEVDLASARGVVLAAVSDVSGVLADPAPDAQIAKVGAAWARIVAHGWVDTAKCALGDAQAAALVVASRRLHEAGLGASTRRKA